MKKHLILIALCILLSGCTKTETVTKINYDPLQITMKASNVSATGGSFTVTTTKKLSEPILAENRYWIEYYDSETKLIKWESVEISDKNKILNWNQDDSLKLTSSKPISWTVKWNQYGTLKSGKYRFRKIFRYQNKDYIYYAYFEIR